MFLLSSLKGKDERVRRNKGKIDKLSVFKGMKDDKSLVSGQKKQIDKEKIYNIYICKKYSIKERKQSQIKAEQF